MFTARALTSRAYDFQVLHFRSCRQLELARRHWATALLRAWCAAVSACVRNVARVRHQLGRRLCVWGAHVLRVWRHAARQQRVASAALARLAWRTERSKCIWALGAWQAHAAQRRRARALAARAVRRWRRRATAAALTNWAQAARCAGEARLWQARAMQTMAAGRLELVLHGWYARVCYKAQRALQKQQAAFFARSRQLRRGFYAWLQLARHRVSPRFSSSFLGTYLSAPESVIPKPPDLTQNLVR